MVSTLLVPITALIHPGNKGIIAFFFPSLAVPFLFFSLRSDRASILFNMLLIISLSILVEFIEQLGFRASFAYELSGAGKIVVNSGIWIFIMFELALLIFAFNYFNMIANNKIESQRRFQRNMLDNLDEGIFCVDHNMEIQSDYSAKLESILNRQNLKGLSIEEAIFRDSKITNEKKSQINSVLLNISSSIINFEANSDFLPMTFERQNQGELQMIRINWAPIAKDGLLDLVLFTISDITNQFKSEQRLQAQNGRIEVLNSVLEYGIDECASFFEASLVLLEECNESLLKKDIKGQLIKIHTLKGNARVTQFATISAAAHSLEEYYTGVFKENASIDQEIVASFLSDIKEKIFSYQQEINRLVSVPSSLGNTINSDLEHLLAPMMKHLSGLCVSQNIEPVNVHVFSSGEKIDREKGNVIRDIILHLIRNSISHGIEPKLERIRNGKSESGNIFINVTERTDNDFTVVLKDDGRGLNIFAIANKSSKVSLNDEDQKIASEIFDSGFTTKESVDEISGRGVGMDAVKTLLEKMGGSIDIVFTAPRTAEGYRPFAFKLRIPSTSKIS